MIFLLNNESLKDWSLINPSSWHSNPIVCHVLRGHITEMKFLWFLTIPDPLRRILWLDRFSPTFYSSHTDKNPTFLRHLVNFITNSKIKIGHLFPCGPCMKRQEAINLIDGCTGPVSECDPLWTLTLQGKRQPVIDRTTDQPVGWLPEVESCWVSEHPHVTLCTSCIGVSEILLCLFSYYFRLFLFLTFGDWDSVSCDQTNLDQDDGDRVFPR